MKLISRQEAIEQGLRCYFTGLPCKHGHVAGRSLASRECLECGRMRSARRQGYTVKPRKLEKASPIHITKADAIELGHKTYFTGLPCRHGHIAERVVGTGFCVRCKKENQRKYKSTEAYKAKQRERRSTEAYRAARRERARKHRSTGTPP